MYATTVDLDAVVGADQDTLLELASDAVDDEVGRPLTEAEYVETFEPDGDRIWVVAAGWPLEVASVVEDGTTLTVDDDFTVAADGALDRVGRTWGDEVTVTFTTGFADGSEALKTARRIVLQLASMAAANPQGLDQFSADGVSPSFVVRDGGMSLPPLTLNVAQKRQLAHLKWRRRLA